MVLRAKRVGSHFKQVTQKPSKYLFSPPAFRAMYYKTICNVITDQNARGKLPSAFEYNEEANALKIPLNYFLLLM